MEPQLVTSRNIVDANRLAIKEGRLQAFLDPKDFGQDADKWLQCLNIVGPAEKGIGCSMGVTYSHDLRKRLSNLNEVAIESGGIVNGDRAGIKTLVKMGFIAFKNESIALIAENTQRLHDSVAIKSVYEFRSSTRTGIGEIDSFKTEEGATTDDFKRWLDIIDKYAEEIDAKAA